MFNPRSASQVSNAILRVAIGLTMVMVGISAYRDLAPFLANITDSLGPLEIVGTVWGMLLPALLIFGGGLLAVGRYSFLAAWAGGVALASVPLGVVLKTIMTGLPLPSTLSASYPSIVWLIGFYLAVNRMPEMEENSNSESN